MKRPASILSFICISLFLVSGAMGQAQEDTIINAWVELGSLKFTPTRNEASAGVDVVLKFQRNRLLTNIQYHDYVDRELAHGSLGLFTSSNNYHAGNLMLGITNKRCRFGHVSVSSGFGLFWGEFDEYPAEKFVTVSLPVEAAASVNLFPFIGLNMKFFANINSKHSLIGFGMDIQLGKLRDYYWIK